MDWIKKNPSGSRMYLHSERVGTKWWNDWSTQMTRDPDDDENEVSNTESKEPLHSVADKTAH